MIRIKIKRKTLKRLELAFTVIAWCASFGAVWMIFFAQLGR